MTVYVVHVCSKLRHPITKLWYSTHTEMVPLLVTCVDVCVCVCVCVCVTLNTIAIGDNVHVHSQLSVFAD